MATITVRELPEDLVARVKESARRKGHSMEHEIRELLASRYPTKAALFEDIRESWKTMPPSSKEEIDSWIESGRP